MSRPSAELPGGEAVSGIEPVSAEAVTGSRTVRAALAPLPASWLERVLAVSVSLPTDDEDACARTVVEMMADLLPRRTVSVRMPGSHGGTQVIRPAAETSAPRLSELAGGEADDGDAAERVLPVDGEGLITLHLRVPGEQDGEAGFSLALAERAAGVLRAGLAAVKRNAVASEAERELRALRAHMIQAEKLASLGQIAAGVVHELNNPLTSIMAYTEVLLRRAHARGDADGDLERLQRIRVSADRMLRFTRDLVSYARPSSEMPVPVDIESVADQSLAFCEHVLNEADVEVERQFGPYVPLVRGKPEQLAQVFVNLITNACHALQSSPREGEQRSRARLVIQTAASEGAVEITVRDNGHGIEMQHVDRVFAPFFTTKGTGLGTGLGLTIVKSIVEAHQGEIRVASRTEGADRGTIFTLRLPAVG